MATVNELLTSIKHKQLEQARLVHALESSMALENTIYGIFDQGAVTLQIQGNTNAIQDMTIIVRNNKKDVIAERLLYKMPIKIILNHCQQFIRNNETVFEARKNIDSVVRIKRSRKFLEIISWLKN